MRVFKDACEIALSKADLEVALGTWIKRYTLMTDQEFRITSVTLHPGNKYVARMVVEPSLKKETVESIETPFAENH